MEFLFFAVIASWNRLWAPAAHHIQALWMAGVTGCYLSPLWHSTLYVSRAKAQWLSNCHRAQKRLPFSGTMELPMCLRRSCLGHQGTEMETHRCFPMTPPGKQWKSAPHSPLTQKFRTKARIELRPERTRPETGRYQLLTPWKMVSTYSPVGANYNHS